MIDFNKLIYDDASKFLDVNNHNALTARYLEEISKLKYKVKYLENKINRCEFAQSTNVKSNFTKSPTENITSKYLFLFFLNLACYFLIENRKKFTGS